MYRKLKLTIIKSSFLVMLGLSTASAGIVADHNAVAQFDSIPQQYIDSVKHMLLYIVGESHSTAFGFGIQALAAQNPRYPGVGALLNDVQKVGTASPSYPTFDPLSPRLRMIRGYGGEDFWFANLTGVGGETRSIERILDALKMYNSQGVSAMGFGWCWDMYWAPYDSSISTTIDPVYRCHWYGRSSYGPRGDKAWGLDAEDSVITRNPVNIGTYLKATQTYIDSCTSRGYKIKPYFSTGPVDPNDSRDRDTNEQAYQRELKHNRIREYVSVRPSVYLFDFADILCYNNAGQLATGTWTDDQGTVHTFHNIHPDYMVNRTYEYHFGPNGALRIAKATWWMLARMAGWSGVPDTKKKAISLKIMPENNVTFGTVSQTQQFTATAHFDDESESNVTGECTWLSQNSTIVESLGAGLFIAKSAGNVNVFVNYSTLSDTVSITAVPSIVDSLYITPKSDTVKFLDTLRFSCVAFDQYEKQMGSLLDIVYTVKGSGTIESSGLYHAPSTNTVDTVIAKSGAVVTKAVISVLGTTNSNKIEPKKNNLTTLSPAQKGFSRSFNTMGRMVGAKKEKHVTAAGYTISKQNSTNKPSSSIIFHEK